MNIRTLLFVAAGVAIVALFAFAVQGPISRAARPSVVRETQIANGRHADLSVVVLNANTNTVVGHVQIPSHDTILISLFSGESISEYESTRFLFVTWSPSGSVNGISLTGMEIDQRGAVITLD